jgi:hypothetical protein
MSIRMTKGAGKSGFAIGHSNRGKRGPRALAPGFPGGVLLDDPDRKAMGKYRWSISGNGYLQRHHVIAPGKYTKKRLHQEIMGYPDGIIDHINGNKLDNRRCNLRITDDRGNAQNQCLSSRNTSGHRGVSWNRKMGKWYAHAKIDRKMIWLGLFDDLEEAARVALEFRKANYTSFIDR